MVRLCAAHKIPGRYLTRNLFGAQNFEMFADATEFDWMEDGSSIIGLPHLTG